MPRTDPLADERLTTVGLLLEAHAALTRELERRLERDSGLSVQWFEVLLRLARSPGGRLRMSDLAASTTLTPSGLTRAVDRLVDAGFVEREACESDRRGAFAVLTGAGRRRIADAVPSHLAHVEELLGGALSPAEQAALASALRKLRDHVDPAMRGAAACGIDTGPG